MNPTFCWTPLSGPLGSSGRPAIPLALEASLVSQKVSPSVSYTPGTTQGNPHLQPSPGPRPVWELTTPILPPPCGAYLPQLRAEKGAWVGPPSPWVGNYATFCLPNQKHALGKGGEGNFVIGFN